MEAIVWHNYLDMVDPTTIDQFITYTFMGSDDIGTARAWYMSEGVQMMVYGHITAG